MNREIQRAFVARNIVQIVNYILNEAPSNKELQFLQEAQMRPPSTEFRDACISRFLSIDLSPADKIHHRRVLYHLLVNSLLYPSDFGAKSALCLTATILIPLLRSLCRVAANNLATRDIFFFLARFLLEALVARVTKHDKDCAHVYVPLLAAKHESLLDFIDFSGLRQVLGKINNNFRFSLCDSVKLQYRMFCPFFTYFDDSCARSVLHLLSDLNNMRIKDGENPIFLSHCDYAKLLHSKNVLFEEVIGILKDLAHESAATSDNIGTVKSSSLQGTQKSVQCDLDEQTTRETWGTIFSQPLATALTSKFPHSIKAAACREDEDEVLMCSICQARFTPFPSAHILDTDSISEILHCITSKACDAAKAELLSFEEKLSERSKFTERLFSIDALNVGYYAKSRWSKDQIKQAEELESNRRIPPRYSQIDALVNDLFERGVKAHEIQIILPEKHCMAAVDYPENMDILNRWRNHGILLECPDGISDDVYWLLLALYHWEKHKSSIGKVFIVSNDQMRDHQVKIEAGGNRGLLALFKQWKSAVQVFYEIRDETTCDSSTPSACKSSLKMKLHFPPKLMHAIQISESCIHVPFDQNELHTSIRENNSQAHRSDASDTIQWLCIST